MSQIYHIELKADDLKLGQRLSDWALARLGDGSYPPGKRIVSIVKKRGTGMLRISLDDCSVVTLHPEHYVVIEGLA